MKAYLKILDKIERNSRYKNKKDESLIRRILSVLADIATIISTVFVIILFALGIETIQDYKEKAKYSDNASNAANLWVEDISRIKIGCSQEYVNSILGDSLFVDNIEFHDNKYTKDFHTNPYCTIMCFYNEDSTLIGFVLIGNNTSVKAQNYRCGFKLFETTINETEDFCEEVGVQSYILCKSRYTNRMDSNSFYIECNMQHSQEANPPYYIGYGICSIGAVDSYDSVNKAFFNMNYYDPSLQAFQYREKSLNDSIRDIPINTFFIMSDIPDCTEFMNRYIVSDAVYCIPVDDYANFQSDYSSYINDYNDNYPDLYDD